MLDNDKRLVRLHKHEQASLNTHLGRQPENSRTPADWNRRLGREPHTTTMPSLQAIQTANSARAAAPKTALFVGATSGIGLGAVEALLAHNKGSTVFVVGRSESRFAATLARLRDLDPSAGLTFLEAQVSLLHDVDRVCAIVAEQIDTLEILWLSQGGLGLRENNGSTSEGLPVDFAVSYYGRVRFMQRLAPLLSKSPNGRVISVLCAGMEGSVNAADPGLRDSGNYAAAGFWGAQKQGVTMQSLAMQTLAAQNPAVTFIHTNPGAVSSEVHAKWSQAYTGWWTPVSWLITAVLVPLMRVVGFTPEQAGETGLFAALDETLGRKGAGWNFFRVNERADDVGKKGAAVLAKYREDGTSEKIWEHTLGVFDRILAG